MNQRKLKQMAYRDINDLKWVVGFFFFELFVEDVQLDLGMH